MSIKMLKKYFTLYRAEFVDDDEEKIVTFIHDAITIYRARREKNNKQAPLLCIDDTMFAIKAIYGVCSSARLTKVKICKELGVSVSLLNNTVQRAAYDTYMYQEELGRVIKFNGRNTKCLTVNNVIRASDYLVLLLASHQLCAKNINNSFLINMIHDSLINAIILNDVGYGEWHYKKDLEIMYTNAHRVMSDTGIIHNMYPTLQELKTYAELRSNMLLSYMQIDNASLNFTHHLTVADIANILPHSKAEINKLKLRVYGIFYLFMGKSEHERYEALLEKNIKCVTKAGENEINKENKSIIEFTKMQILLLNEGNNHGLSEAMAASGFIGFPSLEKVLKFVNISPDSEMHCDELVTAIKERNKITSYAVI